MKNKIMIVVIALIIIAFIIIVLSFCTNFLNTPYMKVRMFKGDRITGSFNMLVNNLEYDPMEASVEFEDGGTSRLSTSGDKFSIAGGDYGLYKIIFYLENEEIADLTKDDLFKKYPEITPLRISFLNANNWNIANIEINATLEKTNGEWSLLVNISNKYLTEDYKTYDTEITNKTFIYNDIANSGADIMFWN